MRLFEFFLIVILALFFLIPMLFLFKRQSYAKYISDVGIIVFFIHFIYEGLRLQMILIYTIMIIMLLIVFIKDYIVKSNGQYFNDEITQYFLNAFMIFALIVSSLLPTYIPVLTLPETTGKYLVSTSSYKWTDTSRLESLSENQTEPREIMVQFWYPGKINENSEKALYLPDADIMINALNYGETYIERTIRSVINTSLFNQLYHFKSNSYKNEIISDNQQSFPVIIFSHGIAGLRTQNTFLCEELASHGYIVISIDHTYESFITVFPDNSIRISKTNELINKRYLYDDLAIDDQENLKFMDIRKKDILFTLEKLKKLINQENNPFLDARVDMSKIGIIGFSTGGSLASHMALKDERIKAGINLDGILFKSTENFLTNETQSIPFFFFISDTYSKNSLETNKIDYLQVPLQEYHYRMDKMYNHLNTSYKATIKDSGHFNFCEYALFMPFLRNRKLAGNIDPKLSLQITSEYSIAFFNKYLKNSPNKYFESINKKYPEVIFEHNN